MREIFRQNGGLICSSTKLGELIWITLALFYCLQALKSDDLLSNISNISNKNENKINGKRVHRQMPGKLSRIESHRAALPLLSVLSYFCTQSHTDTLMNISATQTLQTIRPHTKKNQKTKSYDNRYWTLRNAVVKSEIISLSFDYTICVCFWYTDQSNHLSNLLIAYVRTGIFKYILYSTQRRF